MPSPRQVVIYPGAPKTGSSALQTMLRCSVSGLEQAGGIPLEACDREAIEFLLSFEPEESLKSLLESLLPREPPIRRAARRLRPRARAALRPSF